MSASAAATAITHRFLLYVSVNNYITDTPKLINFASKVEPVYTKFEFIMFNITVKSINYD